MRSTILVAIHLGGNPPQSPRWIATPRSAALRSLLAILLFGCSAEESTLSVFTAASLGPSMEEAGRAFERDNPGVDVRVTSAGSQILERQIEAGARADLFLPASPTQADALGQRLFPPRTLACNEPVLIVTRSSRVTRFSELALAERIVIGAPEVPIGAYTQTILERSRSHLGEAFVRAVRERVVSHELDVRHVVTKVVLGEADAGIVYRSDALAADGVRVVPIDAELNVQARYPIAILRASSEIDLARRFSEWLAEDGFPILEERGFSRCDP